MRGRRSYQRRRNLWRSRASQRAMEHQQVPDTRRWMVAFLALALTMIAVALALQAFGPQIR